MELQTFTDYFKTLDKQEQLYVVDQLLLELEGPSAYFGLWVPPKKIG